jgi:DNA recombination protein RmuC
MSATMLVAVMVIGFVLVLLLQFVLLSRNRNKGAEDSLTRIAEQNTQLQSQLRDETTRLRSELSEQQHRQRTELTGALGQLGQNLDARLEKLTDSNAQRMNEIRVTLENRLKDIQADNAAKLELMRKTVDEKLHATLEKRLGESFQLVSERLEQVHKGLGEMQTLASGVGDLKRVLTNVKSRGGWGEVQLESILEQIFTPEQFSKQVIVKPGNNQTVDCAIRLPGHGDDQSQVWLPIDAKFPSEDYERLLDAQDRADIEAIKSSGSQLERAVRLQAKSIGEKYIAPPYTTDFAVMFLPTEGLYAEVIRRPNMVDSLQRDYRVVLAGPTTLTALLNSLQMGFRTLAVTQRSSEVWKVLSEVKTEFGKFGDVLDKVKKKLGEASDQIEQVGVRTRKIDRQLRDVEALPIADAQKTLGSMADDSSD